MAQKFQERNFDIPCKVILFWGNWKMLENPIRVFLKVSVKEKEVPTEKNSSRASIFATKASYISN